MAVSSPRSLHAGCAPVGCDVCEVRRVPLALEFDYGYTPHLELATIASTIFSDHPLSHMRLGDVE